MSQVIQPPNNIKPMTLTIMPVSNSHHNGENISDVTYVPLKPIIQNHITLEEKEAQRLAKQRIRNSKYRDRTKPYTELSGLDTEKEKIMALVKLCYPHLTEINPLILDSEVSVFIKHITRKRS